MCALFHLGPKRFPDFGRFPRFSIVFINLSDFIGIGSSFISNVVQDTTPQLGGNLDVQAREINTSTTNGNIKLNPNGTGYVEIRGDGTTDRTTGEIQLNYSNNNCSF